MIAAQLILLVLLLVVPSWFAGYVSKDHWESPDGGAFIPINVFLVVFIMGLAGLLKGSGAFSLLIDSCK